MGPFTIDQATHDELTSSNRHPSRDICPSLIPCIARRPVHALRFDDRLPRARRQARESIPVCPGVYAWLNECGSVVYVGKSKSLRHRLVSYFATDTTDPKMSKIRRQSKSLLWEPISHELLALVREQELIDRLRPPLNVEGQPDRRQPGFVCIGRGQAPSAFFARKVPSRAAHAIGPIAGRARLGSAIVSLNYAFRLRDCSDKIPMNFSNQLLLFQDPSNAQCLRFELGSCPGPCAGNCRTEEYGKNVQRLLRFLRGVDLSMIDQLNNEMTAAAAQMAFERASVLRDQLADLNWLSRRVRQLNEAQRRLHGILVLPGFDHRHVWMVLKHGTLQQCIARPLCTNEAWQIAAPLGDSSESAKPAVPQENLDINLLMLFATWIKKQPGHFSTIIRFDHIEETLRESHQSTRACA